GLVAFASSLDQIGPFARTAADCAVTLEAIAGHDPADSTSLPEPAPRLREALTGDVSGLVIGLPKEFFAAGGVAPAVLAAGRAAGAELERAGAKARAGSLPPAPHPVATHYPVATPPPARHPARSDR